MKMNKMLIGVCVLIAFSLFHMTACQTTAPLETESATKTESATENESPIQTDTPVVLQCERLDITNGGPFSPFLSESDLNVQWGRGMYQSETAAKEARVTFEGEEYQGVYSYSYVPSGTGVINDVYKPEIPNEADYQYFEVNSVTGELLFIHLASPGWAIRENEKQLMKANEIEEIARQWAAKWVPLDSYEKTVEYRGSGPDFYAYRFWSKVNGVETTDYVDLLLSNKGSLVFIGASQPGWTREHKEELQAFPLEEAVRQGIESSGFSSPVITVERFGITNEGEVVLLLGLAGTQDEGSLMLVIRNDE